VSHLEFSFIVPPTSNRKQSATPEAVFKSKIRPQQSTISSLCYIEGRKDSGWGGSRALLYMLSFVQRCCTLIDFNCGSASVFGN